MKREQQRHLLELIRWPLDILALELAFSIGVAKTLDSLGLGEEHLADARRTAYVVFVALAIVVVNRYQPGDTHVHHYRGRWPIVAWSLLAFLLAFAVPYACVHGYGAPGFWSFVLAVGTLKAFHALEVRRVEEKPGHRDPTYEEVFERTWANLGEPSSDDAMESLAAPLPNRRLAFLFRVPPTAFALRVGPTVAMAAIVALAIGLALGATNERIRLVAFGLLMATSTAYIVLSGMSRSRFAETVYRQFVRKRLLNERLADNEYFGHIRPPGR